MTEVLPPETADFPVNWQEPGDEQKFWVFYGSYMPEPFTYLEIDIILAVHRAGFHQAYMNLAAGSLHHRYFNNYLYAGMHDIPFFSTEQRATWKEQFFTPFLAQLLSLEEPSTEQWAKQWPQDVKRAMGEMDQFDLTQPLPKLVEYLDETIRQCRQIAQLHLENQFMALMVLYEFEAFYQDLFHEISLPYYNLLHTPPTYTLRGNQDLWRLSQKILANPAIKEIFLTLAPIDIMQQLHSRNDAQEILSQLNADLEEYGKRSEAMLSTRFPSWLEEPTTYILNLKSQLLQPNHNFEADLRRKEQQYSELLATTRAQLTHYPQPIIDHFETLLIQAQRSAYILDEHSYWLEQVPNYYLRRIVIAIGRALVAAGCITHYEDIFQLHLPEIHSLVRNTTSYTERVEQRKADMVRFKQMTPPPFVGILSSPPLSNPIIETIYRYTTLQKPLTVTPNPNELLGYAASAGTVIGPVKVLHSIKEVVKLQPGDILVTQMTTAIWTSIFFNVAGVITDNGGMLSHPAIVAREIGIPAVVGTGTASKVLRDGQIVELNGTTGQVKIL